MGFRERVVADVARILGATGEFAETFALNGTDVRGIFEEGDTRFYRGSPGGVLNGASDGGGSRLALIHIPASVTVSVGDIVTRGGREWYVSRPLSLGIGLSTWEVRAAEFPIGG